jgi:hypothetical protein
MPWGMLMGSIGMNIFAYGMNAFGIDGAMQTAITGIMFAGIMAYITNIHKIREFQMKFINREVRAT